MKRLVISLLSFVFFLTAAFVFTPSGWAHGYKEGDIKITHPWARATAGQAVNGAVYVSFDNQGKEADRLLSAASPIAEKVELHTHLMEEGVMKMRPVPAIDLPAGATVTLKPGGLHIMLFGLKAPLVEGTRFPLTLVFEKA